MLTDGSGPGRNPLLPHTPGSAALCRRPTACARAWKSETEKGLALAAAKAWHLHLGKWHTGFLLFFLAPGTPSSFAGRTQCQEVVAGTLRHSLADQSSDPVARPEGRAADRRRTSAELEVLCGKRVLATWPALIPLWILTHPQTAAGPQNPG